MGTAPYCAPPWLPGGHAQTLYPLLIRTPPRPLRRERWETPDGDFIDVDRLDAAPEAPLTVLFHGLEGSSASHYATSTAAFWAVRGEALAVPHFRGCSGEPNRLPRGYHSGDSDEIDWILRRFHQEAPQRPLRAAGVSLGGNALLKWLGEREETASALLAAAAAVCAPLDLTACGNALGRGLNRIYTAHFLATLKPRATLRLADFPGLFDGLKMREARTLREFDDAVTAPLHGFAGVDDYWQRASAKPWLPGIRVPTLLLNPRNDPFLPACALPDACQRSRDIHADYPAAGGHVGFVTGPLPGSLDWLPARLHHFFSHGT